MKVNSIVIGCTLVLLMCLCALSVSSLNDPLAHKVRKLQSYCMDECVKPQTRRIARICSKKCSKVVDSLQNEIVESVVEEEQKEREANKPNRNNRRRGRRNQEKVEQDMTTMNTEDVQKKQEKATQNLWELYHRQLMSLLTNGGYSNGFQLLIAPIELTDIRADFQGVEDGLPLSQIVNKDGVNDYDNMRNLVREIDQVSLPGPFFRKNVHQQTTGRKWHEAYSDFLQGVKGVKDVKIPEEDFNALNTMLEIVDKAAFACSEKYMKSSTYIQDKYDEEQFRNVYCRDVKQAEERALVEIGIRKAKNGNNPAYEAALALGRLELYTDSKAFLKVSSFRAQEYRCLEARRENKTMEGTAKSSKFMYTYSTYKETSQSFSFSVSVGYGPFSASGGYGEQTGSKVDLASVGGVEIKFEDVKYYPIYPGDWFTSSAIEKFRYHPRESTAEPIEKFFGKPDSRLTLMPKGLYVVVNPTLTFYVENKEADSFYKATQAQAQVGARIFGISFGGGFSRSTVEKSGSERYGYSGVTIRTNNCKGQLIAMESHYNY